MQTRQRSNTSVVCEPILGNDRWHRYGATAQATTPVGSAPQYGLVNDLGNAQWESQDQFNAFIQDQLLRTNQAAITQAQQQLASAHDLDMQRAMNFQSSGLWITDAERPDIAPEQSSGHGLGAFLSEVNPVHIAEGVAHMAVGTAETVGHGVSSIFHTPAANAGPSDFQSYQDKGGLLTEEEFNQFDEGTRKMMVERAQWHEKLQAPGIKQGLAALAYGYRGLSTAAIQASNASNAGALSKVPVLNLIDPTWLRSDAWSQSWRDSQDITLGNAILDTAFNPYVSDQQLEKWRKNSSLFQLSSFGTEFAVGWYADPATIAVRSARNVSRAATHELPIRQGGSVYNQTLGALKGIEPTGPLAPYTRARANSMMRGMDDLFDHARNVDFATFRKNKSFSVRDIDGDAGAYAIHYAANNLTEAEQAITKQAMFGHPDALNAINKWKTTPPEELLKYNPGVKTFLDAIDATKTKLSGFQEDLEGLLAIEPKSSYQEWVLHRSTESKQAQIAEAETNLAKYQGYQSWLDSIGTKSGDSALPMLQKAHVSKAEKWSDRSSSSTRPVDSTFVDNHFGWTHRITELPKTFLLQKANVAPLHDLDTTSMSIERQIQQIEHLGYKMDPEVVDSLHRRIHTTQDTYERMLVLADLDETYGLAAISQKYALDQGFVKQIYDKFINESNRMNRTFRNGNEGAIYSTAPTSAERMASGDGTVKLVERSEDGEYLTVKMMDGNQQMRTITAHKSAFDDRGRVDRPVDPTQTVDYYAPLDLQSFNKFFKEDYEVLHELHSSFLHEGTAAVAQALDKAGSAFHKYWKPLQLWRAGWPMRVLMDENARAFATLGPMHMIAEYAPTYAKATANAVIGTSRFIATHTPYLMKAFRSEREFPIGPGPLARAQEMDPYPFARDAAVAAAPKVPESLAPRFRWNNYKQVAAHAARNRILEQDRFRIMNTQGDASALAADMTHPIEKIRAKIQGSDEHMVFSPMTGNRITTGYVIPLPHTAINFNRGTAIADRAAHQFYETNAKLLGSEGYRIITTPEGKMMVGRWTQGQAKADEFATALRDGELWDLRTQERTPFTWQDRLTPDELAMIELERGSRAENELMHHEGQVLSLEPGMSGFDFHIDSLSERVSAIMSKRFSYGNKPRRVKSADGKRIEYSGAYAGHEGQLQRSLISSEPTMNALSEGLGSALSLARKRANQEKVYAPPTMTAKALERGSLENKEAVQYYAMWASLLNRQVAHSPVWKRMLAGHSDDEIINWLDTTPEGAQVRHLVKHEQMSTEQFVLEHRNDLNYYLPDGLLRRQLAKGQLKPSDLRKRIADDDRPTVYGPSVDVYDKRTAAGKQLDHFRRVAGEAVNKIWYGLGTKPIDTLSRQPFAKAMYDLKMRNLINSSKAEHLSNDMIAMYQDQAQRFARDQVNRVLWDLTESGNFTHAIRFIAPFWGAQQEAMVKWARIIMDRPETLARFYNGQRALYSNLIVTDAQTGEQKKSATGKFEYSPTDLITFRIPKGLQKGPLKYADKFKVPIASANVVLQGETPLFPGAGPIVTVPADKFLRLVGGPGKGTQWDQNGIYRWLFPIGRPQHGGAKGVLEQLSPGYGRRLMTLMDKNGKDYQNTMFGIAREMQQDWIDGKRPDEPTDAEIRKATDNFLLLRTVVGLTAPTQMQFQSPHQFWIDQAHNYKQQYGADWQEKYIEDFGTAYTNYMVSSSNAVIDVPPTELGMEEWAQNRDLIAKYPTWARAIIGPDAYTGFSQDVYNAQFDTSISSTNTQSLRQSSPVQERFAEGERIAGWNEYRKFNAALEAELYNRGLHSLQQNGAEDLVNAKRAMVAMLTDKYHAWRVEYDSYADDTYERVHQLQQFAFDPMFDNRPDMQGVRQYLMIRKLVTDQLDAYGAAGGSRSLQNTSDPAIAPLREWFYTQVGQLIQANPSFGDFYSRFLDGDTLEKGGGDYIQ